MHKGKGASRGTKERLLHIVSESVNDVYDFDQQDASHISSANLQSAGLIAEFRSPKHIKCDATASRKRVKNKMLYSANAAIEASHSGKTSTPCGVTGHQKTKKKTPGTPAPWVVLSRLQQNSLAAYTVSPIAVEHNSPNDLSRLSVNSMFEDTSSVMDDSAVFIPLSDSDKVETGNDCNNKISVASFDRVPSSTQCAIKDTVGESSLGSEKHKSETDSGYPRFDSQCEFISLSAGDNIGTDKEDREISADDHQEVDLPVSHDAIDSGGDGNNKSAEKQARIEKVCMLKTCAENASADSDCEVVLYKPGKLDPEKFNSSAARGSRKFTSKRYQLYDDVEPSDTSDDSDVGVSGEIKSKSLIRGKLNQSVEDATPVRRKPSCVLRTRNGAVDSNSTSASSATCAPSIKVPRKADRKTESAEMPSDECLHDKKLGNADVKNDCMLAKPKSRHKPNKKQNNDSRSDKEIENVLVARVTEEVCAGRVDSGNGDADCK